MDYSVPDGWEQLPPTEFRRVNLRPGGHREVECYLTLLPGEAGGLLANVNRWRQQVGQGPITEQELNALPMVSFFKSPAVLIDLRGPFQGMTGAPIEDARLVGTIQTTSQLTLFVKMTGPAELVAEEYDGFRRFVASLGFNEELLAGAGGSQESAVPHDHDGDGVADHPPGQHPADQHPDESSVPHDHDGDGMADHAPGEHGSGGASPGVAGSAGPLRWTTPAGWSEGSGSSMRLVTYVPEDAPATECYVTVLGGDGGGMLSNINRWRGQFGMDDLSTADLLDLPMIEVLGEPSTVVEARGPYTQMSGETLADQALLGLVCIRPAGSVFVKMIGPPDQVEASREGFLAFVQSMEVTQ